MAERLYPGIYIEERPGKPGAIEGVSTSTLCLVGFTLKGLDNVPILVTSFGEFSEKFGDFTEKGLTPTEAFAFFQNGGTRLMVVRIVPSDAASSSGALFEEQSGWDTGVTGDGVTASYPIQLNKEPVVGESVSIVAGSVIFTDPAGNGVLVGGGLGGGGSGAIDYDTGEVTITLNTPADFNAVNALATWNYGTFLWELLWPGAAGDDYRVRIQGAPDFEVISALGRSSASFTRFRVLVEQNVNGEWQVSEQYEDVDFTDSAAVDFLATVFNDEYKGSSIMSVLATGNDLAPSELAGVLKSDEDFSGGQTPAYDGSTKEFAYELGFDAHPATVTLAFNFGFGTATPGTYLATGNTTATQTVYAPTAPWAAGDANGALQAGDLLGPKVEIELTLASAPLVPISVYDDGAGNMTSDGTPTGDPAGTIDYDTGQIDLDFSVWSAPDTIAAQPIGMVKGSLVGTVDVQDDGDGNMAVLSTSSGPINLITLNENGTNDIDYTGGTGGVAAVTLTWRIVGFPGFGPLALGDDGELATYYTAPSAGVIVSMTGGSDSLTDASVTSSEIISPVLFAQERGMYALEKTDEMLQLVISDFQDDELVCNSVVDYCELRKDRFGIFTVPEGLSPAEAVTWKKNVLRRSTNFAALYAPHIRILDPVTEKALNIPCGGHVAGIYARTDVNKNVAKAPAGTTDGALRFLLGLEQEWTRNQVGVVYPNKINALVAWPQTGLCVWGARTLEQAGGEFPYIGQRRLFMFLEKSIFNATHIHVFEDNGPGLWARIRFQVNGFMLGLFRERYFSGTTPGEAYFVICDESINDQESSLIFCDVGVATKKPGEFLVFRFSQKLITEAA